MPPIVEYPGKRNASKKFFYNGTYYHRHHTKLWEYRCADRTKMPRLHSCTKEVFATQANVWEIVKETGSHSPWCKPVDMLIPERERFKTHMIKEAGSNAIPLHKLYENEINKQKP